MTGTSRCRATSITIVIATSTLTRKMLIIEFKSKKSFTFVDGHYFFPDSYSDHRHVTCYRLVFLFALFLSYVYSGMVAVAVVIAMGCDSYPRHHQYLLNFYYWLLFLI